MRLCFPHKFLLCLTLLFWVSERGESQPGEPVSVVVAPDVLVDYELFLRGRRPPEIVPNGPLPRRDVLEMIVLLQALRAGGVSDPVEYVVSPSLERHVALLKSGGVALSAAMINLADLDSEVDIVREIDFDSGGGSQVVGLYTSSINSAAMAASSLEDVLELSAVSNKAWRADWRALEAVDLKDLVSVSDWATMCRIVALGRVDFLIAPFRLDGKDYIETAAGRLQLMKGFGLVLSSERRFVVSSQHERQSDLHEALKRGFVVLEQDDFWIAALKKASASPVGTTGLTIINPTRGRQTPGSTRAYTQ